MHIEVEKQFNPREVSFFSKEDMEDIVCRELFYKICDLITVTDLGNGIYKAEIDVLKGDNNNG